MGELLEECFKLNSDKEKWGSVGVWRETIEKTYSVDKEILLKVKSRVVKNFDGVCTSVKKEEGFLWSTLME
jgi:hypothetical protein